MAYALVTHAAIGGTNGGTTSSIDTSGANLLVCVCAYFTTVAITDSKSNTWTALTNQNTGVSLQGKIFYVANPTVGTGHTFTVTETGGAPSACFASFSGGATTTPFDQQNGSGTGGSVTSAGTGSITPTVNNELVIAGLGAIITSTATIDSGMTILDQLTAAASRNSGLAYIVQTTAGAISPAWTWTGGSQNVAEIASFKVAASGAVLVRSFGLISG